MCGFAITAALLCVSLWEHHSGHNVRAVWLFVGACLSFCFGCFVAWSKADDRANERRPKLGLWADRQSLYLTHLQGDPARYITIDSILKRAGSPLSTKLHFDSVDFLSSATTSCQKALSVRLEILPGKKEQADMGKVLAVMFSGHSRPSTSFPVTIRFQWNQEEIEERLVITWIATERRFETRPQ